MLGKHVNVSARNQKLIKKLFCVFMAIVLVGLMIPHGIAAQLNAYAGNDAETPATEITEANDNPTTESEEVTNEDPATAEEATPAVINEAEPVADSVNAPIDYTFTVKLSDYNVYIDDSDGQAYTPEG